MKNNNRLVDEALSILKTIHEDQVEDRFAYRNEVHRLTASGLSLSFANIEHFLDRYGYISIDQRSDVLQLTSSGIEAAKGDGARLSSLADDIAYHFAKEIEEGKLTNSAVKVNTGKRFDQHFIRFEGVGRGGVGSVWRAEHLKTARPVAIKTLEGIDEVITSGRKSTLKKRLERNIRQLAQLSHPFICPILDLSVHHTPPYYVMPLYMGGSLRDALRDGPMQPEVALNLFSQICLGMQHAHQQGVMHLDLKPENILLDERGNVRIFDFGLSRTIAKQVAQVGRQSYVGFGSVAYMAPELLRDPQHESRAVDIYALGLILYEMLIGELPGRRSPMPSDVIEGLPSPIDDLFDSMTQDATQSRPQDMEEVLDTLSQVPPFDRLASQSMVMTFISAPYSLPGLKQIEIPEIEEGIDIQRDAKQSNHRQERHERERDLQLNTPKPRETESDPQSMSPHQLKETIEPSTPTIKSPAKPLEESPERFDKAATLDPINDRSTNEISDNMSNAQITLSSVVHDEIKDHVLLDSDLSLTETTSSPSPLLIDTSIISADQLEEIDEPLEDIEELEVLEEEVISSAVVPLPVRSSTHYTEKQSEHASLFNEAERRLDQRLNDDESNFLENETTALHDTPEAMKPHAYQPPQSKPRQRSSVSEQLFARQQQGNRFKP